MSIINSNNLNNGSELVIFTDGASRGNPGAAAAGVAIYQKGVLLDEISCYLGEKTNNEAEYLAVVKALEWMHEKGFSKANFFADSQLVVRQLNGEYKVKAPKVIPLFKEVCKLKENFSVTFNWVRRGENNLADGLANRALDER